MKQLTLLLLLSIFSITIMAQEVAEVQKSLITKRTATWCSFCGTWGWTLFDHLVADNHPKAVMVAAHFGDSQLENPTSLAWVNNLGGSGQPRFYLNNTLQSASSGAIQSTRTNIKDQVDQFYTQSPIANTGIALSQNGNQLQIEAKVRFFQMAQGEYYLGLYIVEDSISAQQSGIGMARHKLVLREAVTTNHFGEMLVSGTVPAGTDIDFQYSINLSGYDTDQVRIIAVIWKKEGNNYQFVNVETTPELSDISVNTRELAATFPLHVRVLGNPGTHPELQIISEQTGQLEVSMWNSSGQLIRTLHQGLLTAGQSIQLPMEALNPGIYWVRIRQGNILKTERVLIQ
jgi:hypothetical protein